MLYIVRCVYYYLWTSFNNDECKLLVTATIQEDVKQEIKEGTYKIEIAPSDLVDFGGQMSFNMTHELLMRNNSTIVLMLDFSFLLKEYEEGETTECKLVSNFWIIFCLLTWLEGSSELLQSLCVRRLSVLRCPFVNCIL